ncbi:MAG: hypothetical protein RIM84_05775 [Alphaproteobacteria bacterium]
MKFFFDNCTSPVLASTFHGFVSHYGHAAVHIKDLPCGRDAPDVEWIRMLGTDEALWVIITGDDRIRRNRAEQTAFRVARLRGFVLHPSYNKTPMHEAASFLLWRWQGMKDLMELVEDVWLFELPMNRRARMRQLSV